MFGSAAPFWSGVLHFLVTPLALMTVIALAVTMVDAVESTILLAVTVAAATTFLTSAFFPTLSVGIALFAVASIGVIGAIVTIPSTWLTCVIAIFSGIAAGISVGGDNRDWGASLGASIAMLILASWIAAAVGQLQSKPDTKNATVLMRRLSGGFVVIVAAMMALIELNAG